MSITELSEKCHKTAVEKGFYDAINMSNRGPIWLSNRLMLIVSELAEGLEGVRDNNFSIDPKSGGLGEELADACIRIFDLAYSLDINLDEAIRRKMVYNASRPYKHERAAL